MRSLANQLELRPYREEDEPAVLELLQRALGPGPTGDRSAAFFRWKHAANPFGRSFLLVCESEGHVIGLRAFMRWRLTTGPHVLRAVIAVDTATDPDHQGKGVFSRLTRAALEELRSEADLVFNTPNDKSLPGYLKMGWGLVGKMPVFIRIRRPARFVRNLRRRPASIAASHAPVARAQPARTLLSDTERIAALVRDSAAGDGRLSTVKDARFLMWRYGMVPDLDYRAVAAHAGRRLAGLAIFRVRPRGALWETTVSDLLVPPGDVDTARRLLRDVVSAADVDHLACHFAAGSTALRACRRAAFVQSPSGIALAANPLHTGIAPNPLDARSWALTTGDLEVF
jgi:GNAT superfamily N-acetyltransferase